MTTSEIFSASQEPKTETIPDSTILDEWLQDNPRIDEGLQDNPRINEELPLLAQSDLGIIYDAEIIPSDHESGDYPNPDLGLAKAIRAFQELQVIEQQTEQLSDYLAINNEELGKRQEQLAELISRLIQLRNELNQATEGLGPVSRASHASAGSLREIVDNNSRRLEVTKKFTDHLSSLQTQYQKVVSSLIDNQGIIDSEKPVDNLRCHIPKHHIELAKVRQAELLAEKQSLEDQITELQQIIAEENNSIKDCCSNQAEHSQQLLNGRRDIVSARKARIEEAEYRIGRTAVKSKVLQEAMMGSVLNVNLSKIEG